MKNKKAMALLISAVLIISVLFSACGESKSSDSVKLGGTFTLTGNLSASGDFCNQGLELLQEDLEGVEVNGQTIEFVIEDCGSDQQSVINATNKMIANKDVVGVFGVGNTSADALACAPAIEKSSVPHMVFGSSPKLFTEGNEYMWLARMSDNHSGVLFAKAIADELGMKKPAIINVSETFGTDLRDEIMKNLKETYDIEPVFTASYNVDEKNFVPILTQVKESGADGIVAISHNFDAALVAKAVDSMELDLPKIGSASYCSVITAEAAGDSINGWYSIGDWSPNAINEKGKDFTARFVEAYDTKPDKAACLTYDSFAIMIEAMRLSGENSSEGIIKGLKMIDGYDGVMTTYTYHDDRSLADTQPLVIMENGEAMVVETVSRD